MAVTSNSASVEYAAVFEDIDAIISTDIPERGVIRSLYAAARARVRNPLTLGAATALRDRLKANDRVIIATGAQFPNWPVTETDGPVGAAVLARALSVAFGVIPVVITEEFNIPILQCALRTLGLHVVSLETTGTLRRGAVVREFPIDDSSARAAATALLAELKPAALVSVEKPGRNHKGVLHSGGGFDLSSAHGKVDYLFEQAGRQGILTLGIGDGGNEIGMSLVAETVRKTIAYGSECRCPCRGGTAPATETDYLITATVSNWGAYGLAASLAALLRMPEVFHDEESEAEAILSIARMGAADGSLGYPAPYVDRLHYSVHVAIVRLLRARVDAYLRSSSD